MFARNLTIHHRTPAQIVAALSAVQQVLREQYGSDAEMRLFQAGNVAVRKADIANFRPGQMVMATFSYPLPSAGREVVADFSAENSIFSFRAIDQALLEKIAFAVTPVFYPAWAVFVAKTVPVSFVRAYGPRSVI